MTHSCRCRGSDRTTCWNRLAPVEWDRSTARDSRLGRDVAIKVLLSNDPHDAEQLARFERDEQSPAALNHPHIASIHKVVEAEGRRVMCGSADGVSRNAAISLACGRRPS